MEENLMRAIDQSLPHLTAMVTEWANINSYSSNTCGLELMKSKLLDAFSSLKATVTEIDGVILLEKRSHLDKVILLGGHYDTVYPKDSDFQKAVQLSETHLNGPGVADMKGGLLVLLKAVEAFESVPISSNIGWKIYLNPDEEIGSPRSMPIIQDFSKGCSLALIYEPVMPDGKFVDERKGSANYHISIKGKEAHAGRDFFAGKSAIYPIATLIHHLESMVSKDTTINVGTLHGGTATCTVPGSASCTVNVRSNDSPMMQEIDSQLQLLKENIEQEYEVVVTVSNQSYRPPKPLSDETQLLMQQVQQCGTSLGLAVDFGPTGGVCDGNNIQSFGIPTVDTMGVIGGHIHTHEEFLYLPSLTEKIKLSASVLLDQAKD